MKPEVLKPKYLRPGDLRLERNQTKNMIREIPGQRLCVGVRVKNRPFLRDEKLVKSLHERLLCLFDQVKERPWRGISSRSSALMASLNFNIRLISLLPATFLFSGLRMRLKSPTIS
jgi:hypothetical protein